MRCMKVAAAPGKRRARAGSRALGGPGDDRLVSRVRSGDARALDAMYDRYHRGLLSFCWHMLGSRAEAEEAVRQTFVSAQRALALSEEPVALRAWLYAIALNRCVSMLRGGRVGTRKEPDTALTDLARLPEDQRAGLLLAEAELGTDEIAQVLGVPAERARALVVRARDSLIGARRPLTTECTAVRAELAGPGDGGRRRSDLRRHLRDCPRCRGYRESVRRQKAALAVAVVPSAGLREAVVGAAPRPRRRVPMAKLAIGAALVAIAVATVVAGIGALSDDASTPAAKPPRTPAAEAPASAATAPHRRRTHHHRRRHRHDRQRPAQTAAAAPAPQPQPAPAPAPPVATASPKAPKHTGPVHGDRKGLERRKDGADRKTPASPKPVDTTKAPKSPKTVPPGQLSPEGGTAAPPAESDHHGRNQRGGTTRPGPDD